MSEEKSKIDLSCRTAEEFTKVYYKTIDKQRHLIQKLYMDTGVLIWNGNNCVGNDRIQKFYMDLPSSDHTLVTLDAQPILDMAVGNRLTFIIQVGGTVKYQDKIPKSFQQSFMITAQADKWKILTDCFRLQEPLVSNDKS